MQETKVFLPEVELALVEQEITGDAPVPIPTPVRQIYGLWRPTPLYRARRFEEALQTPARIFYFNLSGHGHFDLSAYDRYLHGEMEEYVPRAADVERALACVPRGGRGGS